MIKTWGLFCRTLFKIYEPEVYKTLQLQGKENVLMQNLSEDEIDMYYLDLLNYREISNQIADEFEVIHQSPQILLIKNGKAVSNASHEGINELQLSRYL